MIFKNFVSMFGLLLAASVVPSSLQGIQNESGYLKAVGKPTGAGLFVDGKYLGPAGRFTIAEKYALPPGEYKVTLSDPRCQDFHTTVTITPNKTTKVRYELTRVEPAKPPFGRLRLGGGVSESFLSVASGDTSAVYINGKFYGHVDELNNAGGGILLNPGVYRVKVSSPIYGEIERDVTVEANEVTVVPLETGARR